MKISLIALLVLGAARAMRAADAIEADVVIYGATPGGIVTAVRAAREGLHVVLLDHAKHVGGMMSNGLGVMDTIYDGKRAPLFDEVHARIMDFYREKYGPASPQYLASTWPKRGTSGARPFYEPHVAEQVFEAMLARETNIVVLREYYPVSVVRRGRRLEQATFQRMKGADRVRYRAPAFVDASYEGDLASVANVAMTWGRESRQAYGEPHAGVAYAALKLVTDPKDYFPSAIHREGLNLRGFRGTTGPLLPGSTGEGDRAIQAYNFRVCWTSDPANRMPIAKPARYERDLYLELRDRWAVGGAQQNHKSSWNTPILVGGADEFPNGDWTKRDEILQRHRDFAMGMLWFLQHDSAVPENLRAQAMAYGLPKDEFTDNGGFPWEMYERETRRLVGRYVFTEHDALSGPGLRRAPVHADSIAFTEWPIDSHSCTLRRVDGSDHEGKILLTEETRPGQVPYRCLLPKEIDNLLVTVCLSCSHIGWGTIRLEPTWMHIGESAGYALAEASRAHVPPAELDPVRLQSRLIERGVMVTFFNEFDLSSATPAQRAAEFFGARGFFPSYDANLGRSLTRAIATVWARPDAEGVAMAKRVAAADGEELKTDPAITAAEFAHLVGRNWPSPPAGALSRGAACEWLFGLLKN